MPQSCVRTSSVRRSWWSVNDSRSGQRAITFSARSIASAATPYVMTRALQRRCMARTSGSSAFSTAVPSAGRHSINLRFWAAMASADR